MTTVCVAVPALTPYFLLPASTVQLGVIAVLSVINGASAFACCSIADSIAVTSVGGASSSLPSRTGMLLVFAVGTALCIAAPAMVGIGPATPFGIFFSLSNLVVAVSEGIAKASGRFQQHQLGMVISGVIFPLPLLLLSAHTVDAYIALFSVVRIASIVVVFMFVLSIEKVYTALRNLGNGNPQGDRLTQLSILGFGYAFLERLLISTVSLTLPPLQGKFFLAVYQAIGILTGIRSQLVNTKFHLIKHDYSSFVHSTTRILRPLLGATPILAVVGAVILVKAHLPTSQEIWLLGFAVVLITLSSMADLCSAAYGVVLTFTGNIAFNVRCELMGIVTVGGMLLLQFNVVVAVTALLSLRLFQFYLRSRAMKVLL